MNNADHKWSFTLYNKSELPRNIVVNDFVKKFNGYTSIVDVRENLQNYDFNLPADIDQTENYHNKVNAQIEFILLKTGDVPYSFTDYIRNETGWFIDYFTVLLPRYLVNRMPANLRRTIKKAYNAFRSRGLK